MASRGTALQTQLDQWHLQVSAFAQEVVVVCVHQGARLAAMMCFLFRSVGLPWFAKGGPSLIVVCFRLLKKAQMVS